MPIYALGLNIGMQISQQTDFKNLLEEDELEILLAGFGDIVKGENTANPMDVLQKYGPQVNELLRERMDGIMEKVKKDGKEYIDGFLDCNDEAEKTDSGLVYYCMKEGDGASPSVEDEVEVHYHGTLTDGTVFDSSVDIGRTQDVGVALAGEVDVIDVIAATGQQSRVFFASDSLSDSKLAHGGISLCTCSVRRLWVVIRHRVPDAPCRSTCRPASRV